jgi:hypothetical protein
MFWLERLSKAVKVRKVYGILYRRLKGPKGWFGLFRKGLWYVVRRLKVQKAGSVCSGLERNGHGRRFRKGGVVIMNGRSRPSELRNYRARRVDGMLDAIISEE